MTDFYDWLIYPILLLCALPLPDICMDPTSLTCQQDTDWLISSNTVEVKLHIQRKSLQCIQLSLLSGGSLYFRAMVITQGPCNTCALKKSTKCHVFVIFWFWRFSWIFPKTRLLQIATLCFILMFYIFKSDQKSVYSLIYFNEWFLNIKIIIFKYMNRIE